MRTHLARFALTPPAALAACLCLSLPARAVPTNTLVSAGTNGAPGNQRSGSAAISADGRFIAFLSDASSLAGGDTNDATDVFVRDLRTGETALVSVAPDGTQANDWSDFAPSISADGRYVAFLSQASNLVAGDDNGVPDVFVRDTLLGVTVRASVAPDGTGGNDASWAPSLSGDGHYLAFVSNATNLVAGDTNGAADVFVRDLWLGRTAVASVSPASAPGDGPSGPFYAPALSGDGRTVAFESWAANLVSGDANGTGDVFARGPLYVRPFSSADVALALRIAAGIVPSAAEEKNALNVETTGASVDAIDFADALRIARKAAGLEP